MIIKNVNELPFTFVMTSLLEDLLAFVKDNEQIIQQRITKWGINAMMANLATLKPQYSPTVPWKL